MCGRERGITASSNKSRGAFRETVHKSFWAELEWKCVFFARDPGTRLEKKSSFAAHPLSQIKILIREKLLRDLVAGFACRLAKHASRGSTYHYEGTAGLSRYSEV